MKKGVAAGKNCRPLGDITNLLITKEDAEHETPSPKKRRIDIDAADVGNELAAVEYVDGLYMFYKLAEGEAHVHDYMDSSSEINEKRRACLVDWLIAVHQAFTLETQILYLTINIIDRVVSVTTVSITELQLVGICALLLASKYERTTAPLVGFCLFFLLQITKMYKYIDSLGIAEAGSYRLISSFPRRVYSAEEMGMTLKDAGLHPRASLFLELL